jgi:hypothetical protein
MRALAVLRRVQSAWWRLTEPSGGDVIQTDMDRLVAQHSYGLVEAQYV